MARNGILYTSFLENDILYPESTSGDDHWREELVDPYPNPITPATAGSYKWCSVAAPSIGAREGNNSIKFRWDVGDPLRAGNVRCELKRPSGIQCEYGKEYWIGWSVFFEDNTNNQNYIAGDNLNKSVVQFHHTVSTNRTSQLHSRLGQWQFAWGDFGKEWCGNIKLGQWNDFVLHCRSHETDGFAYLWINADSDSETPVYSKYGDSAAGADHETYNPKIGIYHGWQNIAVGENWNYIEFYIDSYRIGDDTSDFLSVAPPIEGRVGIIATGTVADGTVDITGGNGDDQWLEEIHDDEPWRSETFQVIEDPEDPGNWVMKFYWHRDYPLRPLGSTGDTGGKVRSELKRLSNQDFIVGNEYWIGFRVYIPDTPDQELRINTGFSNNHVVQFHEFADPTSGINVRNGNWQFSLGTLPEENVGAIELGRWHEFVVNFKLAQDSTGFCRAWLNATSEDEDPVYEHLNTSTSRSNNWYTKIGIYCWWGIFADQNQYPLASPDCDVIEHYIDDYRIGDETSTFASVLPGTLSTYYLDGTNGSDSNNGLSITNAFATTTHAFQQLQPGSTLYIRTGTYTDWPTTVNGSGSYNSGTSERPITIKTYPGDTVYIKNSNRIKYTNLFYWVFEDLVFWTCRMQTFSDYGSNKCGNMTWTNCTFQHASDHQIDIRGGNNWLVENCTFDNIRARVPDVDAFGVILDSNNGQLDYFTADNCLFRDIGGDGIQTSNDCPSGYMVIRDCTFEVQRPHVYRDEDGNVATDVFGNCGENGMDIKTTSNNVPLVEGCTFRGFRPADDTSDTDQDATGDPWGTGLLFQGGAQGAHISRCLFEDNCMHIVASGNKDYTIENCLFYDCVNEMLPHYFPGGFAGDPCHIYMNGASNWTVEQNTFYQSDFEPQAAYIHFRTSSSNNTIRNNVFYGANMRTQNFTTHNNLTCNYNAWSQTQGSLNNQYSGPNDVTAGNLQLDSSTLIPDQTSAVFSAGASLGYTFDFYLQSISRPDMGGAQAVYVPIEREGILNFSGAETDNILIERPQAAPGEDNWAWDVHPQHESASFSRSSEYSRAGTYSHRFFYDRSWTVWTGNNSYRSEITRQSNINHPINNTRWYGWSLYIPDTQAMRNMISDTTPHASFWQLHDDGATGSSHLSIVGGNFEFEMGRYGGDGSNPARADRVRLGPAQAGVWYDFVCQLRLSQGSDGFCKVWMGTSDDPPKETAQYLVYDRSGIGSMNLNNNVGTYNKVGIYRSSIGNLLPNGNPVGTSDGPYDHVVFHTDEIRLGDASSNFESVAPGGVPVVDPPERQGIIYHSGAEGGITIGGTGDDHWLSDNDHDNQAEAITTPTGIARNGNQSIRFYWDVDWPGDNPGDKRRAELKRPSLIDFYDGEEHWVGFSVFFEDNANNAAYIADSDSNKSIIQFHSYASSWTTGQLHTKNGQWQFRFADANTTSYLGPVELGKWNDFVLHCKVSKGSDGFAYMWLNADSDSDAPVYSDTGQNIPNDETRVMPKLGLYHGPFEPSNGFDYIEWYADEYRIGDDTSDFDSVNPDGTPTVPPTDPVDRTGIVYFSGGETDNLQENGSGDDDTWGDFQANSPAVISQAFTTVDAPNRAGDKAIRIFYDGNWGPNVPSTSSYRAELSSPGGSSFFMEPGDEGWIGFSIYIPDNTNHQNMISTSKINAHCVQWHAGNATDTSGVKMQNGQWSFAFGDLNWEYNLGAIELGVWTDFVIHYKVSRANDGFCKMWINADSDAETPAFDKEGVSIWPTSTHLYQKIGCYRSKMWPDEPDDSMTGGATYDHFEIFYDEYRMGDETSDFQSVKPGEDTGGPTIPPKEIEVEFGETIYILDGQQSVYITLTGDFSATGKKVWLSQNIDGDDKMIEQEVVTESSTFITFNADFQGVLESGPADLYVGDPV